MVILGIDPGTQRMGYGLVRSERGRCEYLAAGVVRVSGSSARETLPDIKTSLSELIRTWQPEALGIEKLFFTRNRTTALPVAQARGVALLCAAEAGLAICELSPNEIKSGLTGDGRADKRAVAKIVRLTLRVPELDLLDDAMDALAAAICASQRLAFEERARAA